MKKYIFGFFVLCFSFLFSASYAEKPLDSLEKQELIDSVETLNNRLKADYYMFKEGGFKERLEAESKKWESEHAKKITEIESKNTTTNILIIIFGVLGISSAAVIFMAYKVNMNKIIDATEKESRKRMDTMISELDQKYKNHADKLESDFLETIASLMKSSPATLRRFIHTREEEYKMIRNAEVLVVSPAENDGNELRNLFNNYGFDTSKIEYKTIEEYTIEVDATIEDNKKASILVFNDENNGLKNYLENLKDYEKNDKSNKRVYFYYGKGRLNGIDNSNFSNSKFTFYNNLLALLRYKKLMID